MVRVLIRRKWFQKRASLEEFIVWIREYGVNATPEKAREILNHLIERGYAEGNDEIGYVITEKGIAKVHEDALKKVGVR